MSDDANSSKPLPPNRHPADDARSAPTPAASGQGGRHKDGDFREKERRRKLAAQPVRPLSVSKDARLVYGLNPVREVLRADPQRIQLLQVIDKGNPRVEALGRFAASHGIAEKRVARSLLDRVTRGGRHQGALAWCAPLKLSPLDDVLGSASALLMLDGVTDPHNFGATLRSCVAFGADAVLWGENHAAPLTAATFRASAGAVEHATLCQVSALRQAVIEAAAAGFVTVALDSNADHDLQTIDLTQKALIVIGAEDTGVSKGVRKLCAKRARLPIGSVDSLNASVAAAVAMYELRRQRVAQSPAT